ncbi:MAG TPA: thiol reductant ABC exporter subunit CydD [Aeromicrobium sp.]|nr:thiol reductant ABC exporter subunit CydD [Aeromicrobium sp.]
MRPLDPELVRRSAAVRRHLIVVVVLGVTTAGLLIAQAWFVADVVESRFLGSTATTATVAVVAAIAVRGLVTWLQEAIAARSAARVKAELRAEVVDALLDPRRVGDRPSSARVVTLLGQGIDSLEAYIGRFLPQVVLSALVPTMIVLAMIWADVWSGLIAAVTVPLIVVFLVLVGLRTQDEIGRRWRSIDRLSRHFADVLDGIVVLRTFGRDQGVGIETNGQRHREETVRSLRVAFLSSVALDLFSTLSVALVAVAVGLRLVNGSLDLATGLYVLLLAPDAFLPIRRLGASFHDSTAGQDAIAAVTDLLGHQRHPGVGSVPDPRGLPIELSDVVVRHQGRDRPSLSVERLVFLPGVVTALTGPSGCGKSTLLSLLLGTVLPDRGSVTVGGQDLTDVDPEQWRRHVAWVPQVPGVIEGTVAQNVRFGIEADDAAVIDALRAAEALDLDPARRIGESATDISAGERRRLAVARAVLRVRHGGASLVLMDEPTAGLDTGREATVLETLKSLAATVVVVSHRPSTLAVADRVVALELPGVLEVAP